MIAAVLLAAVFLAGASVLVMAAMCWHRWNDGRTSTKAEIIEDIREDLA